MTPPATTSERIQDYLDGLLGPAEEAAVRARFADDPEWRREHEQLSSVMVLLGTSLDVAPPPELLPQVLAAIEARAARRTHLFGLPVAFENALVVVGTAVLGGLVVLARQLLPEGGASGWIGQIALGFVKGFDVVKSAVVGGAESVARLDWVGNLLVSLGSAARTVLSSSVGPVMEPLLLVAIGLTILGGAALWRTESGLRERGLSHARVRGF